MLIGILIGWLTFYAPEPMRHVYERRLGWGQVRPCPACIGMVAVTDCDRIGDKLWVQGPQGWEGPFLVVDCGLFRTPGRIAEVDYATALRWGMRGPIPGALAYCDPRPPPSPEGCRPRFPC